VGGSSTHVIVLPGGGYAEHVAHEAEPVAAWLNGLGVSAGVFRYPLQVRHPVPLAALRAEIRRRREAGADRIGLMGFSAGGHLAGLAALAPGAGEREPVDFAVLGYAITSMETETYRPARLILLGEHATPEQRVPPEHTYRLAAALAAHDVAHAVHVFAHGPHSLGLARGAGDTASWTALAASWIAERARYRSEAAVASRASRVGATSGCLAPGGRSA
jgi:acetyl esterase/lipase